jgi:hypothetical protein
MDHCHVAEKKLSCLSEKELKVVVSIAWLALPDLRKPALTLSQNSAGNDVQAGVKLGFLLGII